MGREDEVGGGCIVSGAAYNYKKRGDDVFIPREYVFVKSGRSEQMAELYRPPRTSLRPGAYIRIDLPSAIMWRWAR